MKKYCTIIILLTVLWCFVFDFKQSWIFVKGHTSEIKRKVKINNSKNVLESCPIHPLSSFSLRSFPSSVTFLNPNDSSSTSLQHRNWIPLLVVFEGMMFLSVFVSAFCCYGRNAMDLYHTYHMCHTYSHSITQLAITKRYWSCEVRVYMQSFHFLSWSILTYSNVHSRILWNMDQHAFVIHQTWEPQISIACSTMQ